MIYRNAHSSRLQVQRLVLISVCILKCYFADLGCHQWLFELLLYFLSSYSVNPRAGCDTVKIWVDQYFFPPSDAHYAMEILNQIRNSANFRLSTWTS